MSKESKRPNLPQLGIVIMFGLTVSACELLDKNQMSPEDILPSDPTSSETVSPIIEQTVEPIEQVPTAPVLPTQTPEPTITSKPTVELTPENPYPECGESIMDYIPIKTGQGPTMFMEEAITNGPLTLAEVTGCLRNNEGKKSNPGDIEEGYENEVVFYDNDGNPHIYRVILGGRSLPTHESRDNMIFADFGTGTAGFMTYDEFEKTAQEAFSNTENRWIRLEFYQTDNDGELSDFYSRIYENSEIYSELVNAIKTGEDFPDDVPDDFFIWALVAQISSYKL